MRTIGIATAAVFIGGGLGAVARYVVQGLFGATSQGFALGLVNLAGCFAIGFVTHHLITKAKTPLAHAFLVPGILGGFTSFSAVMVIAMNLHREHPLSATLVYALGYLTMCVVAVVLGRMFSALRRGSKAEFPGGASLS